MSSARLSLAMVGHKNLQFLPLVVGRPGSLVRMLQQQGLISLVNLNTAACRQKLWIIYSYSEKLWIFTGVFRVPQRGQLSSQNLLKMSHYFLTLAHFRWSYDEEKIKRESSPFHFLYPFIFYSPEVRSHNITSDIQ